MLSFERGIRLAKVKGGEYSGKILYIDEKGDSPNTAFIPKPRDTISDKDIKSFARTKLKRKDIEELLEMLENEELTFDDLDKDDKYELMRLYKKLKPKYEYRMGRELVLHDGNLQPIKEDNHMSIIVAGKAGSGKSTWIKNFVKDLKKRYPDLRVILFSKKDSDPSIDEIEPLRIKLDMEMVDNPIKVEELKNSICIFDDVEALADKKVENAIIRLRDDLVNTGRQYNITILSAIHSLLGYKKTRDLLQEATGVVFFNCGGAKNQIMTYLTKYVGLKKTTVDKLTKLPSRWVYLRLNVPMVAIHSTGAVAISKLEGD